MSDHDDTVVLRRGWTTGACATAGARAAFEALITGEFPDPVRITLPGGQEPDFALAIHETGTDFARAGIVKDAGDDPDVTHGALIVTTLRHGEPGSGITFKAGQGVGIVTRPGLPLPVGEPAINPMPRQMISKAVDEVATKFGVPGDIVVEVSIPNGEKLAERTLNARLGIIGGLSILGTTGIVIPYSCSAWIHGIHRGIDVARAMGLTHVAGTTGNTSENAVQTLYGLDAVALIDMGDFVGGMLKYLRTHPVAKVTIAGGFAKMTKLAQGLLDLHSKRGSVDLGWLAEETVECGGDEVLAAKIRNANTALDALNMAKEAGIPVADRVAEAAWSTAAKPLSGSGIELEIVVFDRNGILLSRSALRKA